MSKIGQERSSMQQADYQCHQSTPWMQESVSMHKSPTPVRHSRMNQARSVEEEERPFNCAFKSQRLAIHTYFHNEYDKGNDKRHLLNRVKIFNYLLKICCLSFPSSYYSLSKSVPFRESQSPTHVLPVAYAIIAYLCIVFYALTFFMHWNFMCTYAHAYCHCPIN